MLSFGKNLKRLRRKADMTQQELAETLCISKSAISCYEQDVRLPSVEMLVKIADVFNVSIDYLWGREQARKVLDITDLTDEDIDFLRTMLHFLRTKNRETKA